MATTNTVEIIGYEPAYAQYFEMYNREWIEPLYTLEELDLQLLRDPAQSILKPGGEIFFARHNGVIIGTAAMKKNDDKSYELSKMGVTEKARGLGAGKALCVAVINRARALGAEKVLLYSNTLQSVAIKLYRKLGFLEIPVEAGVYERANIKMELLLREEGTDADIATWLDNFGKAPELLLQSLQEIPREIWQWQPPHNKWTIHQNIMHLVDSEVHAYVRFRTAIAEPGGGVHAFNQDRWTAHLAYHAQFIDDALALYSLLRKTTHTLLQTLPRNAWEHTTVHPEYGTMKLWQWLRYEQNHTHRFQIQRVYQAWQKQQGQFN